MKKLLEIMSVTALFVFYYNFSWELYPTLILGAFVVAFSISNLFDTETENFTLEEYLLLVFAVVVSINIYLHTNWIGIVAIGVYVIILIQKSFTPHVSKKGMTNKEFYQRK